MKFNTKLWKRSQKSFATTIPHIALLGLDESKEYDVVWEFDSNIKKWTLSLEPKKAKSGRKKSKAGKNPAKKPENKKEAGNEKE